LFDEPAFKNVIVNELILDKNGQKMSKSKGNTVNPFDLMAKYGADTCRWYLMTTSPPWRPTLFDEAGLVEVQRKYFGTLMNTYGFFAMYANIDGFKYDSDTIPVAERPEVDRWVISKLNSLVASYVEAMEAYDVTRAARSVSDFTIDQLSNWYVRRNRRRFWSKWSEKSATDRDKLAAYQTLYECLIVVAKLSAPFAPFLAEELYRNLNSATKHEISGSVHLAEIPAVDASAIDADLEQRMEIAQRLVTLVRAVREKSNLKVRQPLSRILIPVISDDVKYSIQEMEDVILDEINVKRIEFAGADSTIVRRKAKPNFRSLGLKYGKNVQLVATAIRPLTNAQLIELQVKGSLTLSANGSDYNVDKDDVEIVHEEIKGWIIESDNEITVALDTALTPDLISEGFSREFVNRVQNLRKDSGFEVVDRIKIVVDGTANLSGALKEHEHYIKNETLALELSFGKAAGQSAAEFDLNGEKCAVVIERTPTTP
jgi:isoleucyl-tRNA synthetase